MGRVARIMGAKAVAGRREEKRKEGREEASRKEAEAKVKAEEVPGLKDVDPSDKEWVSKHLSEGTYKNDDEVINAMGLKYTLTASGYKKGKAKGAAAGAAG